MSVIVIALPLVLISTDGEDRPAWFVSVMVALGVLGVLAAIGQLFIPLTTIEEEGIRRGRIVRPKKIEWSQVFDARYHSSFFTNKYVLLLLWSGQQVPLYGVTEDTVEGIRRLAAQNPVGR